MAFFCPVSRYFEEDDLWAPATVTAAHAGSTFDVQWDEEGEPFTYGLPRECLRFPKDSPRKSPRKSRNRLERSAECWSATMS